MTTQLPPHLASSPNGASNDPPTKIAASEIIFYSNLTSTDKIHFLNSQAYMTLEEQVTQVAMQEWLRDTFIAVHAPSSVAAGISAVEVDSWDSASGGWSISHKTREFQSDGTGLMVAKVEVSYRDQLVRVRIHRGANCTAM